MDITVSVPPKALLFGEYGVLLGFPAYVVTLTRPQFIVSVELLPHTTGTNGPQQVTVFSKFFAEGRLDFPFRLPTGTRDNTTAGSNRHVRFFRGILFPWADYLRQFATVQITIKGGWPPENGMGSSSAMLAAIHAALQKLLLQKDLELDDCDMWSRLWESLTFTQPGGSGYDVAAQITAMKNAEGGVRLWRFFRPDERSLVPRITQIDVNDIDQFGVFLATHHYSDTTRSLSTARERPDFDRWCLAHGEIAVRFGAKPISGALPQLMQDSRQIATKQGLFQGLDGASHPLKNLMQILEKASIQYKSMGAGYGDLLWVAATTAKLRTLPHPDGQRSLADDVVFSFLQSAGGKANE